MISIISFIVSFLALGGALIFAPQMEIAAYALSGLTVLTGAWAVYAHRQTLKERAFAFGLQSAVTSLIVILIVAVLNFISIKHPKKIDLTKNKIFSISDQTERVMKGLKEPIQATFYATPAKQEEFRALLNNYKDLSTQFKVETINPSRDPSRTKAAKVTRDATLILSRAGKESRIDEPTEEKLTNALIKLLKEKNQTLCVITGHGERNIKGTDAEGYEFVRKEIEQQSYSIREINLIQEQKIPADCDAIAILGPQKPYFETEIKLVQDYLVAGGRGIIAVDFDMKGSEFSPEITELLVKWYIRAEKALIVDPVSRMVNVEPVVPLIANYSKEHAITKNFQMSALFPITRPLSVLPGAPADLRVEWLGQTTKNAWGETDFTSLKSGRVKQDTKDLAGPLNIAIAVHGKYPGRNAQVTKDSRLVVFGTSAFATSAWARQLNNLDFFMNSMAWVLEDEGTISIRSKEDAPSRIELTRNQAAVVFLISVVGLPLIMAISGIVIWWRRRKY